MLRKLIHIRMASIYSNMFRQSGGKGNKNRSKVWFGILAGFLVLWVAIAIAIMLSAFCKPLCDAGLNWLYFSITGILVFLIGFIFSIFEAKAQMFEAKDNELLLSMPIKPKTVLASRMGALLLSNYIWALLIFIPAVIVYCLNQPLTVAGIIFFIVSFILTPFLTVSLSCILGWIIAIISAKMKHKNIITLILSTAFMSIYLFICFGMQNYMTKLVTMGEEIALAVKKVFFPAYHMGLAIADGNIVSILLFTLCSVVPFLAVYAVLSHNFIKIVTSQSNKTAKKHYKADSLKVSGTMKTLVKKELSHYFSSSMYMLNASIGSFFMLLISVALIIKKDSFFQMIESIPQISDVIAPVSCAIICFCSMMNIISAPSVSLEGKNIWIIRSLPVDTYKALMSKVIFHVIACLPFIAISATVFNVMLKPDIFQIVLMYAAPIIFTVFTALFGLVVNLHFPKLDWISETIAVKQGISTVISTFGGMLISLAVAVIYIAGLSSFMAAEFYILICMALFAVISLILWLYIKHKGVILFEKLG